MKRIRIGNDIQVSWGITTNGKQIELKKENLQVQLVVYNRAINISDFSVIGNVISFKFLAESQKYCGVYTVVCRIESEDSYNSVDRTDAFELVPHTEDEEGRDEPNVAIEVITLRTDTDSSHIGKAATIRVGEVKTLEPGQQAYVKNSGSESDAILDFGIPAGGSGNSGGNGSGNCDCSDKFSKSDIVQNTGESTDKVMSQKAVTDQLKAIMDIMNLNSFALQMYSANGWNFSYSMVTKTDTEGNYLPFTTLSVKAFYYNTDVTDKIYKVVWTRETSYTKDDEVWNLKHKDMTNDIPITYEDLGGDNYEIGDVVFKCEAQYTVDGTSYQSSRTVNL